MGRERDGPRGLGPPGTTLALYLRKLPPGGVLLFHVSNRYLDLPPLLARLAEDQGLLAYVDHDYPTTSQEEEGKMRSTWMLLGDEAARAMARKDRRWQVQPVTPGPVWTDTFSNLLGVWKRAEE